ncbi:MAG: hypothetical protein WC208_00740 [Gallionella sp.]|jgi:hypothetical protein
MPPPEIIFNDVSLASQPATDHNSARCCFEEFVAAIGGLIESGLATPVLRSRFSLLEAEIQTQAGGAWEVSSWLEDKSVDRDMKSLIWKLDSKIPIEEGLNLEQDQEEYLISYEYRAAQIAGPDVYALGVALLTNNIVASVPTAPIWDTCQIDTYVCDNNTLVAKEVVDHVSHERHCTLLENIFRARCFASIADANQFLQSMATLFPNLTFSPDIEGQVVNVDFADLRNAMAKLQKMDETASAWKTAGSDAPEYLFQWRSESESTMSNKVFHAARVFRMPNGGTDVFEKHLDFSKRHRIHYIEDRAARTFIIGYLGNHLPTTKFPH